jgi:Kef-type K+ transport system membrane component KefB
MTLLGLAGIIVASLFGPLLATPRRTRVPVVIGELAVGVVLGTTGLRWVHPNDPLLTFLAQAGFALVMLIAGSHVPLGNPALRKAFGRGLLLAAVTGVVAVPAGAALSAMAHTHHTALYAVLLASSSAAIVMPIIADQGLSGDRVLTLMAQVAIADTACIVALPLAVDPSRAARSAVGAVIVLAVAGLLFIVLRELAERDLIAKLHAASVRRTFGIEMRLSLAALFGLAGLAVNVHVSVMLAGFAFGLILAGLGTPRRLGSQLFAVTEGFLGPVFFVWLGSSLDLRALAHHPRLLVLTVGLAAANVVIHALARFFGQPLPFAILAGAQLGVPVAAVALGTRSLLLAPGEGGAILGAAVLSLAAAAVCGATASRLSSDRAAPSQDVTITLPPRPRDPAPHPAEPVTPVTPSPGRARAGAREAEPTGNPEQATTNEPPPPPTAAPTTGPASRPTPKPKRRPVEPRPPTPNPATKPIVQSNVRVQPSPRAHRPDIDR